MRDHLLAPPPSARSHRRLPTPARSTRRAERWFGTCQFNSGILTGTILGLSDFSASGAQVQVSLPNINTTVNTNSSAVYRITGVPPGTYTLNVTLSHNQGKQPARLA